LHAVAGHWVKSCFVECLHRRPGLPKAPGPPITEWSKPSKAAPSQAITETLGERWWEVFNDPQLSALTQRALTDNLDLKLASSRLQQSRAVRQVITADRYPTTAATASYSVSATVAMA
jgi:outer membrane protein TolC